MLCDLARKIPYIITIEENVRQGGFGSAVLELFADEGIPDIHIKRLGVGRHVCRTRTAAPAARKAMVLIPQMLIVAAAAEMIKNASS